MVVESSVVCPPILLAVLLWWWLLYLGDVVLFTLFGNFNMVPLPPEFTVSPNSLTCGEVFAAACGGDGTGASAACGGVSVLLVCVVGGDDTVIE